MGDDVRIRLDGLGKRFGSTVALDDVSLTIGVGEVFGYLGPNGAGKTTTIRLLMGMLRPTTGRSEVLGYDAWRAPVEVHRRVGYVPGEPAFYAKLTGRQHVDYFGHLRGRDASARATVLAERLELDLERPAGTLSRGNRQKLAVLLALMSEPQVLVLDEPTSGLDPLVQQEFQAVLREHADEGGTVLLSSHVLSEVQRLAHRIGVVRRGRLIAVERMQELQEKALHHVRATFHDDVRPADFTAIPGVRNLHVSDHTVSCEAPQSALDAIIKQVSRGHVDDFECAEAELEETFLAYYGAGDDDAA